MRSKRMNGHVLVICIACMLSLSQTLGAADFCNDSEFADLFVPSSFVSVLTDLNAESGREPSAGQERLTMRLLSRSPDTQEMCSTVELVGLPEESSSGVHRLHAPTFAALLQADPECQEDFVEHDWSANEEGGDVKSAPPHSATRPRLANGRFVYGNGRDLLSYVAPGTELGPGTWILSRGVAPGVDSGHSFRKADSAELSPVGGGSWHWLIDGKWTAQPAMTARCMPVSVPSSNATYGPAAGSARVRLFQAELFLPVRLGGRLRKVEVAVGCEGASLLLDGHWHSLEGVVRLGSVSPGGRSSDGWHVHEVVGAEDAPRRWRVLRRRLTAFGVGEFFVGAQQLAESEEPEGAVAVEEAVLETAVGDFVWAWLIGSHETSVITTRLYLLQRVETDDQDSPCYRWWPSERVAAMHRSELQEDSSILRVTVGASARVSLEYASTSATAFDVHSWLAVGPNLLEYTESLVSGDARPATGYPACFFYHGLPVVPEPLVYAAEIVCTLHGKKAFVMIQYDTPTDKQYRHPLVRPLVRALLSVPQVQIAHEVMVYKSDRTLVLYNREHEALVQALRPSGEAQALHPIPYPNYNGNAEDLLRDEEGQVYNSAWNGFVLGYPLDMIEAYCEDFHNQLSRGHKRKVLNRAIADVRAYVQAHDLRVVSGAERDAAAPLSRELIDKIYRAAYREMGIR